MAAIDVTRAEFEALQRKVQEIEENTVSIGEQFEKFQEVHTEVESKVGMHDDYNLEYTEKIRQLEGMNLESKFHDVAIAIRKFDAMNIEETFKHMADAVTRVQVQVTNDKAEFERLELKGIGGKIEELQRQAKPQPTEATAALMRELEEKVLASTVKSLGKLKGEFDVVKLQVTENIGLNDEKFKKIDEQMTKGANDRKGRIVDRKTFHSSMSKFSGSEGEPEIRGFAFQLRQFLSKDDHYLEMMAWLEGIDGEFTSDIAKAKKTEMEGTWQFDEMDQQFYQMLVATAVPKSTAAHKLMALEKRSGIPRGMMAYHDFTRELLGSTASTRTMIANRVRNPAPITSMDDIEVRLLQWEADLEQFMVYEGELSSTIKMGILKDMVPEAVRQVIRQQKPDSFDKLKQVLKDEAKEHRDLTNSKKLRSKGLHVAEGERWGPRLEDAPSDQPDEPLFVWNAQLNSFVPALAEAEEQTYVWDMNLYTFVPSKGKGKGKGNWQMKGGSKGNGWQPKGGGKGKGRKKFQSQRLSKNLLKHLHQLL